MKRTVLIVAIPAMALLVASIFHAPQDAEAQGGSRTRGGKQAYHETLWGWLHQTDYTKWNGANGASPEFQKGNSPHGALVKIYVSARAATNLKNLPDGSVVIKENYSPDKKLMAVTVMVRSAGYDSKHGDWYYAKYMPSGKIAKTPPEMKSMPIAGKFHKCIECHSGADGDDYSFFND